MHWKDLYRAIEHRNVSLTKQLIDFGVDPNHCNGECGWYDSNPIDLILENGYTEYYTRRAGIPYPSIPPDVEMLQILISAGADLRKRPYVWHHINSQGNRWIDSIKRNRIFNNESTNSSDMLLEVNDFISNSNRVLKFLLDAGADPDMLGHPYPYNYETMRWMNDRKAKKYFEKGTRAINEAIEKGILWESQVDLLLKYTSLDEDSLKAAERSGDKAMILKIQNLWEKQKTKSKSSGTN